MPPTKYKEGGVSECMKFQHPSLGKECMFHNFITLKPAILYAMQVNSLVNGTINFLKCLNLMRGNTLLTGNIRHITTGHTVWQLINYSRHNLAIFCLTQTYLGTDPLKNCLKNRNASRLHCHSWGNIPNIKSISQVPLKWSLGDQMMQICFYLSGL